MKIYKIASFSVYISGYRPDRTFENIHGISWSLNSLLFNEFMDKRDMAYFKEFHTVPGSDTITIDGLDPDSTTGTINFYLDGIIPERIEPILDQIKEYLLQNKVKYGDIIKNQSNMYNVPVLRIPIISNPKGEEIIDSDRPPDVQFANNNAYFIFTDVLKCDQDLWDDGEFDANDLLRRIQYFEGETKLPEGEYAGQMAILMKGEEIGDAFKDTDFLSGRKALSNYDEEKVRFVLNKLKEICQWAISHGYSKIYVA